jgi:serine/threonine protein kinase
LAGTASAASRYRPIRFHARGGLGEVHVAEDAELHREVALKRLQLRHAASPEVTRRFLREAEITARLQHPGVVPVYGLVWDAEGHPWYAMRFVEGESLQEAINRLHATDWRRRGDSEFRLALRELLARFVVVCQTVAYAHSRGVIHRDLKPDNIMVGRFGETLVVDWGLARPTADTQGSVATGGEPAPGGAAELDGPVTRAGEVLGTPAFMSPEQAVGRTNLVGPASDIYSLGATLYVLLTGCPPFENDRLDALLSRVRVGDFPPPRRRNGRVSRSLEAVCLKAMALLPENRYRSAQDVATDVTRWLADEPVSAYRDPFTVRLGRWERRHQWRMPRIMSVLFLLFTLFCLVMLVLIENDRQAQIQKLREELKKSRVEAK